MIVSQTVDEVRTHLEIIRAEPETGPLVFVPTMGSLHDGHLSLARVGQAWGGSNTLTVFSIFVNPTQFAPHEDFDSYPRDLTRDLERCRDVGADLVFAPDTHSVYPADASVTVSESQLSRGLCGASRPHFFGGVCTVVAKLFNIIQPDAAVFGEKDFQQLAIIRRMVRDLNFPIQILGGPIIREADGVAMSSRNALLSSEHRAQAVVLNQALQQAEEAYRHGERNPDKLAKQVRTHIESAPDARIDYVDLVHPDDLEPLTELGNDLLIAVAVIFGETRLIDNVCIRLS